MNFPDIFSLFKNLLFFWFQKCLLLQISFNLFFPLKYLPLPDLIILSTPSRDQLIMQLEKSQDMLMSFQQELNASELELQRTREENRRLKNSPQHPQQPKLPVHPHHQQEMQAMKTEIARLTQMLQETGARGDNELEQWRKVVEQEKNRADQAEKTAGELHKRVQVFTSSWSSGLRVLFCMEKYLIMYYS
jgi:hypothetical protein